MVKLDLEFGGEISEAILALENHATQAGDWLEALWNRVGVLFCRHDSRRRRRCILTCTPSK